MKRLIVLPIIVTFVLSVMFMGIGCKRKPAPAKEAAYKIVFYYPSIIPYFESVTKGLEKFGKDYGIHVDYMYGTGFTQDISIANIESLVAKGYKGICDVPFDANASNLLYEEVVRQGVFVTTVGTRPNTPTPVTFSFTTDVKVAAMRATEIIIEKMGGKGNILNVLELMEDPNTILRKRGIEEVVAKYPDVQIIQEIGNMSSVEESLEKIGNVFAARIKETDGIVATGCMTSVAVAALLTNIKNDRIIFCGIDDLPVLLQAIKDGYAYATIAQNPYAQGYLASLSLKLLIDGYKPKQDFTYVNPGFVEVKKENVDTFINDLWGITNDIAETFADDYFTPPESQ